MRAVNARGPGLPLLHGLRVVPADALTGWKVVAKKGHRQTVPLGTVNQVESIQAEGSNTTPAYQLLRVVQQTVLEPYGFKGQEVHLLPLVPDIVTAMHLQQKLLVIDPPEGLLDLGRRDLLLAFLSQELLPFAPAAGAAKGTSRLAAAAAAAGGTGIMAGARALTQPREMPTRAALLGAGRPDLVNLIMKVGGFTQAALQLGLRASRRPAGYWDSLEVLDMELDAFIAGSWVALPCCHDEADESTDGLGNQQQQQQQQQQEVYFYNTATKSIRWGLPEELQQLLETQATEAAAAATAATPAAADGAAGGAGAAAVAAGAAAKAAVKAALSPSAYQALLDLQEERVMPNLSAIKAAGRWDLYQAITRNGGYRVVAFELERRHSRPLPQELTTAKGLQAALQELTLAEGWPTSHLPSANQLKAVDRTDLVRAITQLGGWRSVAQSLSLTSARTTTAAAWHNWTIQDLARELSMFMTQHHPNALSGSHDGAAAGAASAGFPPQPLADTTQSTADTTQLLADTTSSSGMLARIRRRYRATQQPPPGEQPLQAANAEMHGSQQQQRQQQQRQQQQQQQRQQQQQQQQQQERSGNAQGAWEHLPTHTQVLAAGRFDLLYSLRQHSYEDVLQELVAQGWRLSKRYKQLKQRGVLQWTAVESAITAGCTSCREILDHITSQHQQQHRPTDQNTTQQQQPQRQQPQQQQQQQRLRAGDAQDCLPLVSREHLQRQLKAWVDEGRLVKVARNCFKLPQQCAS